MIIFIESICDDPEVLHANFEMKLRSPDYIFLPPEQAMADFTSRVKNYELAYQSISEDNEGKEMSYIKMINVGKKLIAYNISSHVPGQIVYYLMNMRIRPKTIWITRHGESMYNVDRRIGGDPGLTSRGIDFARALAKFFEKHVSSSMINNGDAKNKTCPPLTIWTSELNRAVETAKHLSANYIFAKMRMLNEIYAGSCEGMTYSEMEKAFPEETRLRNENKLRYRYPGGGESYLDVIQRLKPLILELERIESSVLLIGHVASLRTIYGYFMELPLNLIPEVSIPLHRIIRLDCSAYETRQTNFQYDEQKGAFIEEPV